MKILAYALWLVMLLATVVSAQTITWVGPGNHQPGDYSLGKQAVPTSADLLRVTFDPNGKKKGLLAGNEQMIVELEYSLNGGMTYFPMGGDIFDASKQPADFNVVIPGVGNNSRVIRGVITLKNGPWNGGSEATID